MVLDGLNVAQPTDTFTRLPLSASLSALFDVDVDAYAMLFVVPPLTLVHVAIRPDEGALAIFLGVAVLALVLATIGPCLLTIPVHLVVLEVAYVFTPLVCEEVHAVAFVLAVDE